MRCVDDVNSEAVATTENDYDHKNDLNFPASCVYAVRKLFSTARDLLPLTRVK